MWGANARESELAERAAREPTMPRCSGQVGGRQRMVSKEEACFESLAEVLSSALVFVIIYELFPRHIYYSFWQGYRAREYEVICFQRGLGTGIWEWDNPISRVWKAYISQWCIPVEIRFLLHWILATGNEVCLRSNLRSQSQTFHLFHLISLFLILYPLFPNVLALFPGTGQSLCLTKWNSKS